MKYHFRKLPHEFVNSGYSIIEERFDWLISKGIKQYPFPFPPKETYLHHQEKGLNFGLFYDEELRGIVTLTPNVTGEGWNPKISGDHLWISALYTKVGCSNIGKTILNGIEEFAGINNFKHLLLDCYLDGGFLQNFYKHNGFGIIEKKLFRYGEREFEAALMIKDIS